ncbi:hypothetical protein GCM10027187_40950 [Streptosporangium sandarakinum]|uniref:Uncharacterized protein n=1 Tax=Streptosporangium sandarakinum TaxID=1260955 RepID=A0A852VBG1_9ACTN|nr:hypothetical protein [Streptosporangium sandarakinum]NYF44573.1 hypothetical protein [Streptosporangium sandarakinum]
MTTTVPEQPEQVVGYVVVDADQVGDRSGWMTPRMRATLEQADDDRVFWENAARRPMRLRVAKLVLLDGGQS